VESTDAKHFMTGTINLIQSWRQCTAHAAAAVRLHILNRSVACLQRLCKKVRDALPMWLPWFDDGVFTERIASSMNPKDALAIIQNHNDLWKMARQATHSMELLHLVPPIGEHEASRDTIVIVGGVLKEAKDASVIVDGVNIVMNKETKDGADTAQDFLDSRLAAYGHLPAPFWRELRVAASHAQSPRQADEAQVGTEAKPASKEVKLQAPGVASASSSTRESSASSAPSPCKAEPSPGSVPAPPKRGIKRSRA
jgi:hypothetical protein